GTSTATVQCAAANAPAVSPERTAYVKQRLSGPPTIGGAPCSSAASASAAPGNGAHSVRTSAAASYASAADSAATSATGVPWHRTTSPATYNTSGTTIPSIARIKLIGGNASTSGGVMMLITPGAFRAASTSSVERRACACGLRTNTTCATPPRRRSSRNCP